MELNAKGCVWLTMIIRLLGVGRWEMGVGSWEMGVGRWEMGVGSWKDLMVA
jgi:hypothetical protein